jgi:Ca2+-binding RTX toxin-like protein
MNGNRGRYRRLLMHAGLYSRSLVALACVSLPAIVLAADIVGTAGPDVLEGTPDADKINGKGGADVMMGLAGDDSFIVGQPDDEVLEAVGDGTDTVTSTVSYTLPIHVENLTLGGVAAIDGTGNELDNRLTGNDVDNILDGLAGADRMSGLGGNDIYVVDASGDLVTESPGKGTDRVRSSVTHTLRANVEQLVLTGVAAVSGTGNELANAIRGNPAANTLRGMAGDDSLNGTGGNDRLIGGPGNDKLIGGGGLDIFEFDTAPDTAANQDRIVDFNPADDVIRLIGAAFPALTTAGTLAQAAFGTGASATTAAVRIIHDPGTGILRYDADGNGPGASVRFARLLNAASVTRADFVVVNPVVVAVDFATQVQPIFTGRCTGCHNTSSAPHGLVLDADHSYSHLVNVASKEVPSLDRVEPGNPDDSYVVQKVEGTAAVGGQMPLGRTPLTAEQIALIRQWISEGANP